MTALTAATGLALDTIQVTGVNTKWWPIVAFAVSCAFVIWVIVDLRNRNRDLENRKPSISVTPVPMENLWYLEVTNNGERGVFAAEVCIFEEKDSSMGSKYVPIGSRYNALWGNTSTDKSEILNGQSDIIRIASIRHTDAAQYFVMKAYDPVKKSRYEVRHIEFELFRDSMHPQNIQVIISSDPSLKGGAFIREYSISLRGMTESEPKKRISVPEKYLFGEEDEDEARLI